MVKYRVKLWLQGELGFGFNVKVRVRIQFRVVIRCGCR